MPEPTEPPSRSAKTGVLLIAHGSRRAEANDDLVKLAALISARRIYPIVEVSYLELAPPTIVDGGRACVRQGATRVLMLPYFLSAGVHVVNDLDETRRLLASEYPAVDFVLCPHLGLHPLMAEIVLDRLRQGELFTNATSDLSYHEPHSPHTHNG